MSGPRGSAEVLGLPAGADAAAVRSAVLRAAAEHAFVPSEETAAAGQSLLGGTWPLSAGGRAVQFRADRAAVDAFAARYWDLSPDDRLAAWEELSARVPPGPDAAFLAHLGRGLSVVPVPHPDDAVDRLAADVRAGFVLRPRDRAVRRAEKLTLVSDDPARRELARSLVAADPDTADLDPAFIQRLTRPVAAFVSVPGFVREEAESPEAAWVAPVWMPPKANVVSQPDEPAVRERGGKSGFSFGNLSCSGYLIAFACLAMIRGMMAGCGGSNASVTTPPFPSGNRNSNYPMTSPKVTGPQLFPGGNPDAKWKFEGQKWEYNPATDRVEPTFPTFPKTGK